jgi:RNA ligase (TIGR02306 family)
LSQLNVKVEKIVSVEPHPNADRLDLVQVLDWRCVAQKDSFKVGDLCVYFPIDSLLPQELEDRIFGKDSKVSLTNHRVKTIKLRGAISQGLAITLDLVPELHSWQRKEGKDVTDDLGVTKYEPPTPPANMSGGLTRSKKEQNHNFKKYTDISNIKFYPDAFAPTDQVSVTEKVHGTNFRAGWVNTQNYNWFQRLLSKIGLRPEYEFVYGSHNVQYQNKKVYKGFYPSNVYQEIALKYELRERLHPGEVVYGEIYGTGIQKDYNYGIPENHPDPHRLLLFDVMKDNTYLDASQFASWCAARNFLHVPVIYTGSYQGWQAIESAEMKKPSKVDADQKIREGFVIKPSRTEVSHPMIGRLSLKIINPAYLLKEQTEFH